MFYLYLESIRVGDSNEVIYTKRIKARIAQLVERNLAKVEVASSNLVSRSSFISDDGYYDDAIL